MSKIVEVTLGSQITLQKSEIPTHILNKIRIYLSMNNPKYLENENRGYSTWGVPKFIHAYNEDDDYLYISRGYIRGPSLSSCLQWAEIPAYRPTARVARGSLYLSWQFTAIPAKSGKFCHKKGFWNSGCSMWKW